MQNTQTKEEMSEKWKVVSSKGLFRIVKTLKTRQNTKTSHGLLLLAGYFQQSSLWCAACHECQLVNLQVTPNMPLYPFLYLLLDVIPRRSASANSSAHSIKVIKFICDNTQKVAKAIELTWWVKDVDYEVKQTDQLVHEELSAMHNMAGDSDNDWSSLVVLVPNASEKSTQCRG